jgi:hypothetical protein
MMPATRPFDCKRSVLGEQVNYSKEIHGKPRFARVRAGGGGLRGCLAPQNPNHTSQARPQSSSCSESLSNLCL